MFMQNMQNMHEKSLWDMFMQNRVDSPYESDAVSVHAREDP